MIEAKIIKDSVSMYGNRLTTLQIKIHRYVWADFMSHRAFSRNASSSRAIPVSKMLKQVWNNPALPIIWGSNKPGMQAGEELKGWKLSTVKKLWILASKIACILAYCMMELGLHKQWANRILDPWQWMTAVVSSTDFDNFFALRISELPHPEMNLLAILIKTALNKSQPDWLLDGEWHLPYLTKDELNDSVLELETLRRMSAARCARVSYLNHNNHKPSLEQDLYLCDKLTKSRPIHASPFEHQATPMIGNHGNFFGWKQYRQFVEEKLRDEDL
jgi:hypothetical protein